MRKTLLIAMALCSMMSAQAKEITEAEAARIASQFVNSHCMAMTRGGDSKLQLAKSSQGYYAYNRGASAGFVVVAADDAMGAQVLGYSDRGSLNFSQLPCNIKWWLSQYDLMATTGASFPQASATRADAKADIDTLITCKWDQESPYNNLCPEYATGKRSATGCVATAAAQVMYYHKWPKVGTGSNSYEWNDQTLSMDFSKNTYDWAHMTDTYDANSTDEEKNAVAVLMRDFGYAVNMQYGDESGTPIYTQAQALVNYFGYDRGIRVLSRDCYSYDEWNDILYAELSEKRPILVGGSAHAFVFDGYKQEGGKDWFHVNWGWGGNSDGYFLCSNLTPDNQGIGSTGSSYSSDLTATIGIQKPVKGSTTSVELTLLGSFMPTDSVAKQGANTYFDSPIRNCSVADSIFYFGLKVCKQGSTDTIYVKNDEPTTLTYGESTENVGISLEGFPKEDGVYYVYPVCRRENDDTWYDLHVLTVCSPYCIATVKGDAINFKSGKMADLPTVTDLKVVESKVYAGNKFHVTATITATNSDYCSTLYLTIVEGGVAIHSMCQSYIDLRKGENTTVTFEATAPQKAGEYSLFIASKAGMLEVMGTVTVVDVPTGELKLEVSDSSTGDGEVDPENVIVGCILKCTSGYFQGSVNAVFTEPGKADPVGTLTSESSVGEGDSAIVTMMGSVKKLEYGKTYNMYIMIMKAEDMVYMSDSIEITTVKSSGINGITNGGELQPIKIYSLNGKLVSTQTATEPSLNALPKGTYIIKVGNSKAKKVINR